MQSMVAIPFCVLLFVGIHSTLYFCSMIHYDITIGNDVVRDVHCDIIMGHDVVMGTYVTMHTDENPHLLCITMPNYDISDIFVKSVYQLYIKH